MGGGQGGGLAVPPSKAAKNTGLPQQNRFFCEKTADVLFYFFRPFRPGDVRGR
jgi:hypothetical protein